MDDQRTLPAYAISEAAHYLSVPATTIRYWSIGRGPYEPLIAVPKRSPALLSFLNLTELHILSALRRVHRVKMPSIREAIQYLSDSARTPTDRLHPLLSRELETDGASLFAEYYGHLINLSFKGQEAMRDIISMALECIERGPDGIPIRLYPFARHLRNGPRMIVIDPEISFGRPVIAGTGLATEIIAERYLLGESISDLVHDYERPQQEIEEAIRCEFQAAA